MQNSSPTTDNKSSKADAVLRLQVSIAHGRKPVLREINLDIHRGEVLGLIGQSGSGKSTLAMAVLGLLDRGKSRVEGQIWLEDQNLLSLTEREFRRLRGKKLGLVLQSPQSSLNPALRIRTQLREAWKAHARGSKADCDCAIRTTLEQVSLPSDEEFLRKFPSQMSVGQAQRVLIGMSIIHRPALLIADEATSALDVITQSEILKLFRNLNRTSGMAILYISHDLASVAGVCDRVALLHDGNIVEIGPTEQILTTPQHEYTQRLLAAMPKMPVRQAASAAGL